MAIGVIAAAIRLTRKRKRKKIDKEEFAKIPHVAHITIMPFPKFAPKWVTSKEAQAIATKKAANEALKKLILGQEIQKQQRLQKQQQMGQSQDAISQISNAENEEGPFGSSGTAYNAIYLGLVLICIGCVITFVGLGEKGFKTLELKMIGPVLIVAGLTCITIKIIHCSFPQMFVLLSCLKKAKLRDSDRSNLMEKGVQNGHFGKKATSPKILSPRVKLQSSKKIPRPTSTIPNYIGNDDSSDDDDFDPGRSRPHSNRYNNAFEGSPKLSGPATSTNPSRPPPTVLAGTTPVTVFNPSPQQPPQQGRARTPPQNKEILLSPKGLIL